MLTSLAAALVVAVGCQAQPAADRTRAEQLVRTGRPVEAIHLFEQIVEQNPGDVEARIWIARLELRLGRTDEAEDGFRSVIREHPTDVDARIGLGAALTRKGAWREALAVLTGAERDAGENSDLFGALARAYRRGGDDRRALEYFTRAKALAPADPDIVSGFEDTARAYGHSIGFEGFGQHDSASANTASGNLMLSVRATDRLHIDGSARMQQRSGASDATAGGGVLWRAGRADTIDFHALAGPGNTVLPTSDVSADLLHYAGSFELGGGLRRMSFTGADVVAVSPVVTWDAGGGWRLDTRYTFSRTSFSATGETSGDHSVLLRETWRAWRRLAVNLAYAYGIESFEDLTADRLGALGATTIATGLRINMPPLTLVFITWEHQWRSNDTTIDRLTVSIVRTFP
jgi:tetratricopeptide (TPR) repeat protein